MSTIEILGFSISNRGLSADLDFVCQALDGSLSPQCVVCANPHALVVAASDPVFAAALKGADIVIPDGAGIMLAARLLGLSLPGRVAGMDFFLGLNRRAKGRGGLRYFFLGSSKAVLDLIVARLAQEDPEIVVCGTYSPPFKGEFSDTENADMIGAVAALMGAEFALGLGGAAVLAFVLLVVVPNRRIRTLRVSA